MLRKFGATTPTSAATWPPASSRRSPSSASCRRSASAFPSARPRPSVVSWPLLRSLGLGRWARRGCRLPTKNVIGHTQKMSWVKIRPQRQSGRHRDRFVDPQYPSKDLATITQKIKALLNKAIGFSIAFGHSVDGSKVASSPRGDALKGSLGCSLEGMVLHVFKLFGVAAVLCLSLGVWPNRRYGAAIAFALCVLAALVLHFAAP